MLSWDRAATGAVPAEAMRSVLGGPPPRRTGGAGPAAPGRRSGDRGARPQRISGSSWCRGATRRGGRPPGRATADAPRDLRVWPRAVPAGRTGGASPAAAEPARILGRKGLARRSRRRRPAPGARTARGEPPGALCGTGRAGPASGRRDRGAAPGGPGDRRYGAPRPAGPPAARGPGRRSGPSAGTRSCSTRSACAGRVGAEPTPARVAAALRAQGRLLGDTRGARAVTALRSELVGAGPLAPLLADPAVTDVLVNGTARSGSTGARAEPGAGVGSADADDVRRLAQRLAAAAGGGSTTRRPYVDARLPDGTRLHAVLPPVATGGPYLSLRTFRQRPFTLAELVAPGTVPRRWRRLLRGGRGGPAGVPGHRRHRLGQDHPAQHPARAGAAPTERIVLVEDAAELRPGAPARGRAPGPAGQCGGRRAGRPCATWSGRRCGCGRTGWSSASAGAPRWSTCWPRSTPATRAGRARCTPTPPADVPARLEALGLLGGARPGRAARPVAPGAVRGACTWCATGRAAADRRDARAGAGRGGPGQDRPGGRARPGRPVRTRAGLAPVHAAVRAGGAAVTNGALNAQLPALAGEAACAAAVAVRVLRRREGCRAPCPAADVGAGADGPVRRSGGASAWTPSPGSGRGAPEALLRGLCGAWRPAWASGSVRRRSACRRAFSRPWRPAHRFRRSPGAVAVPCLARRSRRREARIAREGRQEAVAGLCAVLAGDLRAGRPPEAVLTEAVERLRGDRRGSRMGCADAPARGGSVRWRRPGGVAGGGRVPGGERAGGGRGLLGGGGRQGRGTGRRAQHGWRPRCGARAANGGTAGAAWIEQFGSPRELSDLKNCDVIDWVDKRPDHPAIRWFIQATDTSRVIFRANSPFDRLTAAREGMGVALGPCLVGDTDPGLVRLLPELELVGPEVWLLVHRELADLARVRVVLDVLAQCARADVSRFAGRTTC